MDELKSEQVALKKKNSSLSFLLVLLFIINIYLPAFISMILFGPQQISMGFEFIFYLSYSFIMIFVNKRIFAKIKSPTFAFLVCLVTSIILIYLMAHLKF
jgi:hypothetical protein